MKRLAISATVSLTAFALVATSPAAAPGPAPTELSKPTLAVQALDFTLPAPKANTLGGPMNMWATYYHMPTVKAELIAAVDSARFLGRNGKPISLPISNRDWCYAALQGSVRVEAPDGSTQNYVFIDAKGPEQIDCDKALGNLAVHVKSATRRARFAPFNHPAGCDVRPQPLVPYRTVAVDTHKIRRGTILFIPDLRGQIFTLDGAPFAHDGYVVASDRGGAIKGNHIDVFVDQIDPAPFPSVISSSPNATFKAFIVDRKSPIVQALAHSEDRICEIPAASPGIDWNTI